MKIPLCVIKKFNVYHILPTYIPLNEFDLFIHITEQSMYLFINRLVSDDTFHSLI